MPDKSETMNEPSRLGRYQIETFLGKGAFAEVYKAVDTALKRVVALKVLKAARIVDAGGLRPLCPGSPGAG